MYSGLDSDSDGGYQHLELADGSIHLELQIKCAQSFNLLDPDIPIQLADVFKWGTFSPECQ